MNTLADFIESAAERYNSNIALQMRQPVSATQTAEGKRSVATERWTYTEVYQHAQRVAMLLQRRGLRKGDRLIIWASNQPRWVTVFYGAMLAGIVVVPLDVRSTEEFVHKIEARTTAALLLADRALLNNLSTRSVPTLAIEDIDASLSERDSPFTRIPVDPDDPAELVFTSGTTGAPKGVVLTHRNIISNAEAALDILAPQPTFSVLSLLPLSHMFEQIASLFYAMRGGARVTYLDSLQPATIFQAIQDEGITITVCVPQILALFMQGIEREVRKQGKEKQWKLLHSVAARLPFAMRRYLFPAVHKRLGGHFDFFVSGGAYLDPALAQKWENMGVRIIIGYGMTEASPLVTANTYRDHNLHSVGRPARCNEVKIAPDGEVLVRGTNITPGYWQDDVATRNAFVDGWYVTGDLGVFDKKGRLILKGRKKNMIVLANGMNVYPEDVENTLAQYPEITDSVVMGLDDENGDLDVHAILLTKAPDKVAEIVKAANKRLAPHQRIKHFTIWPDEDFPRTNTLKAKRMEMLPRVRELRRKEKPTGKAASNSALMESTPAASSAPNKRDRGKEGS